MPDLVESMPCADGKRRAEPAAFGLYSVNGAGGQLSSGVQPFTASATLLPSDHGRAFGNLGASGSVTLTLPTPWAGARFTFFKNQDKTLVVAAPAGVKINGNDTYTNSTNTIMK